MDPVHDFMKWRREIHIKINQTYKNIIFFYLILIKFFYIIEKLINNEKNIVVGTIIFIEKNLEKS